VIAAPTRTAPGTVGAAKGSSAAIPCAVARAPRHSRTERPRTRSVERSLVERRTRPVAPGSSRGRLDESISDHETSARSTNLSPAR
jgi:hypothetical protein